MSADEVGPRVKQAAPKSVRGSLQYRAAISGRRGSEIGNTLLIARSRTESWLTGEAFDTRECRRRTELSALAQALKA